MTTLFLEPSHTSSLYVAQVKIPEISVLKFSEIWVYLTKFSSFLKIPDHHWKFLEIQTRIFR